MSFCSAAREARSTYRGRSLALISAVTGPPGVMASHPSVAGTLAVGADRYPSPRERWQRADDDAAKRDADFATMSGVPVEPVYGPPGRRRVPGRVPVHARAVRVDVPLEAVDDADVRGLRHRARHQPSVPRAARQRAATGCRPPTTCRRCMGRDSDDPLAWARSASAASRSTPSPTSRTSTRGIDLGAVTTSMTINGAGRGAARDVRRRRRAHRRRARPGSAARSRTTSSRSTRPRRSSSSRPGRRCGWWPTRSASAPRRCRGSTPVSISGYHIREAGSTAAQELAFTLANGFAYVEAAQAAGLAVDDFAPRLSFFFNAHLDFFEEIAKYRAARRIWARWMRDRYGATERAVAAAAVPHPDRGSVAHRAAARGQHRPHRDRGAGRRARRHPEPAHELDGRDARAADREGRAPRAAHPAGDRARDPRRERRRPARRLVVRRGAHRRAGAPRPRRCSPTSLDLGDGSMRRRRPAAGSRRAGSSARSPTPRTTLERKLNAGDTSWSGVNVALEGNDDAPPEIAPHRSRGRGGCSSSGSPR